MSEIFHLSPIAYTSVDWLTNHVNVIGIDPLKYSEAAILDLIFEFCPEFRVDDRTIVSSESMEMVADNAALIAEKDLDADSYLWCDVTVSSIDDSGLPYLSALFDQAEAIGNQYQNQEEIEAFRSAFRSGIS